MRNNTSFAGFVAAAIAALALSALSSPAFAALAPSWVADKNKDYPSSKYISAVGEGGTEKKAQAAAVAQVSQLFDTKTDVVTTAAKRFQSVQVAGSMKTVGSQSLEQITAISSQAEFFGLRYAPAWYNEKRDTYVVLAYIDKQEAAATYKGYIRTLLDAVYAYREAAQKDAEPFNSVLYMQKAESLSVLASQYIRTLGIIEPAAADGYKADTEVLNRLGLENDAYKKQSLFSVRTGGKSAEKFGSLSSAVTAVLEKRGFTCKESGARYTVVADISAEELTYEVGPFVKPSLKITVQNAAGTSLYSYAQAYSRAGGNTTETAYNAAATKIKKDLEANFLPE